MKKICFLSCDKLDGQVTDDHLAAAELQSHGNYQVSTLPWMQEHDWSKFDAVIIRSTWDYYEHIEKFMAKLKLIDSQTKLLNPLKIITWNFHKGYLKELEFKGVAIVPTSFFNFPGKALIPKEWSEDKFVIKPAISASSFKTMIVGRKEIEKESYQKNLFPGDWMIQPYLEEITGGEISLHYFNKKFSHAILKVPKEGDFRVQEEHGGVINSLEASDELIDLGESIIKKIPHEPLYARVDLLKHGGKHLVMEVELIEPSLYFRTSKTSVANFRNALEAIL